MTKKFWSVSFHVREIFWYYQVKSCSTNQVQHFWHHTKDITPHVNSIESDFEKKATLATALIALFQSGSYDNSGYIWGGVKKFSRLSENFEKIFSQNPH